MTVLQGQGEAAGLQEEAAFGHRLTEATSGVSGVNVRLIDVSVDSSRILVLFGIILLAPYLYVKEVSCTYTLGKHRNARYCKQATNAFVRYQIATL